MIDKKGIGKNIEDQIRSFKTQAEKIIPDLASGTKTFKQAAQSVREGMKVAGQ